MTTHKLIASSLGLVGSTSSPFDVTAAPSGVYARKPTNYQPWPNFERLMGSVLEGNWTMVVQNDPDVTIVADSRFSTGSCMRIRYTADSSTDPLTTKSGRAPVTQESVQNANKFSEFYLYMEFLYEAGFVPHPAGQKLIFDFGYTPNYGIAGDVGGHPFIFKTYNNFKPSFTQEGCPRKGYLAAGNGAWQTHLGAPIPFEVRQTAEMICRLNSCDANQVAQPDGLLQFWLNGTQLLNKQDFMCRGKDDPVAGQPPVAYAAMNATERVSKFQISPTFGGTAPTPRPEQYIRIGRIHQFGIP